MHQRFTYRLSTNTVEYGPITTPQFDPGYPADATERRAHVHSVNGKFAAGQMKIGGETRFVLWSLSTGDYQLIGPANVSGNVHAVSENGAAVAFASSPLPNQTWVWTIDGQLRDVHEELRREGIGNDWEWIAQINVSPNGKYLVVTGANGQLLSSAARLRLN